MSGRAKLACLSSVLLYLPVWGIVDLCLCAPKPCLQAVRSELLEESERPVCVLSLLENH